MPRHPHQPADTIGWGRALLLESLLESEEWARVFALEKKWPASPALHLAVGSAALATGAYDRARASLATLRPGSREARILRDLCKLATGNRTVLGPLLEAGVPAGRLALISLRHDHLGAALGVFGRPGATQDFHAAVLRAELREKTGHRDLATIGIFALRHFDGYETDSVPFARAMKTAERLGIADVLKNARDGSRPSEATRRRLDLPPGKPAPRPVIGLPDLGTDIRLSQLGPLRWTPPKAPGFDLERGTGGRVALSDYTGQPVLVVFFLGFGCVHCVEQLGELQPRTLAFKRAGIRIVAIGTDTPSQVKASIQQSEENDLPLLPFPVLCDPKHEAFKRWRCWDEFNDEALHGTFLIDGRGDVLWQDISVDPFMKTDFLLEECQRLLGH